MYIFFHTNSSYFYYSEDLRISPNPYQKNFTFDIDEVLGERINDKGQKEYEISFLGYDSRFNEWRLQKDIVE